MTVGEVSQNDMNSDSFMQSDEWSQSQLTIVSMTLTFDSGEQVTCN